MKLHLELLLSPKQAQALLSLCTDIGLARVGGSDDYSEALVAATYTLSDAIQAAQRDHSLVLQERASRRRPCEACGREVTHGKGGRQLPASHNCPHGHPCHAGVAGWARKCKRCTADRGTTR